MLRVDQSLPGESFVLKLLPKAELFILSSLKQLLKDLRFPPLPKLNREKTGWNLKTDILEKGWEEEVGCKLRNQGSHWGEEGGKEGHKKKKCVRNLST